MKPITELYHKDLINSFLDSFDPCEIRYEPGQGFQGLVDFFINALTEIYNMTMNHSHRSSDAFLKDLTKKEREYQESLMVKLEKEFRERLFDLISGSEELFSKNQERQMS